MFDHSFIKRKNVKQDVLKTTTVREFSGGWNVIDNELNLSAKYAVVLDNMTRKEDGSLSIRWGTRLFANIDDIQWYTLGDLTLRAFNTFAQAAANAGAAVTVTNPAVWHDGNTAQTNAASTRIAVSTTPTEPTTDVVLQLTGMYTTPLQLHAGIIWRPSDGWLTGTLGSNSDVIMRAEAMIGGVWVTMREQSYTALTLPASFFVPIRDAGGAAGAVVGGLRLTVLVPTVPKQTSLGLAVAEMQGFDYVGSGQAPADVYIVNTFYFQGSIVVNLSNGTMLRVMGDGTMTVIWSNAIAVAGGATSGWGSTDFVSYAVFNGELIVCNGTDKPLLINFTAPVPVTYLQDLGTGSNVNVPICRYVTTFNKFLVMAGDPMFPDRVYISNEGTSGTWFGDDPPNNAVNVDLGKVGVQSDQTITGLNRFRQTLVVTFWSAIVLGKLGIYDADDNHTPDFDDVIESIGSHSHRTLVNVGKDLFMLDHQGVPSLARSLYSGELEPKRVSELIDPEINYNVTRLTDANTLLDAHSVYNTNDKQYMCFVPNYSDTASTGLPTNPLSVIVVRPNSLRVFVPAHRLLVGDIVTLQNVDTFNSLDPATVNNVPLPVARVLDEDYIEIVPDGFTADFGAGAYGGGAHVTLAYKFTETIGYVYTFVDELKVKAWSRYRGWNWRASCVTELGRVVLSDRRRMFVLGYENDPIYSDFVGTVDEQPIEWAFELPWTDFDTRMTLKKTRYMQLDTSGDAPFDIMMFVDSIYKLDGVLYPYIMQHVVGGDRGGYGYGTQAFGGGRNTRDERMFDWPLQCKIAKLRCQGRTTRPLQIVAISLAYQRGSLRR